MQTGPHEIVLKRAQKPANPWATRLIEQRNIDRLKERFRGESYFFRQSIHQGVNRIPIHLRSQTLSQYPQGLALGRASGAQPVPGVLFAGAGVFPRD